jgi:hypothetical protein
MRPASLVSPALLVIAAAACDSVPPTGVVFDDAYPLSATYPRVVYRAYWENAALPAPLSPGDSSDPVGTVPASLGPAYVVVAPGWDPTSGAPPASLVVLQSKGTYDVHLGGTVHVTVSDDTFDGNCETGSHLTQQQADFITQLVFPADFASLTYDAATCTATPNP